MKKLFSNCPYRDIEFQSCRECPLGRSCFRKKKARIRKRRRAMFQKRLFLVLMAVLVVIVVENHVFAKRQPKAEKFELNASVISENFAEEEPVEHLEVFEQVPEEDEPVENFLSVEQLPKAEEMLEIDNTAIVASREAIEIVEETVVETDEERKTSVKNLPGYDENVDLLARLIHCEGGICDDEEKYHIAAVAMNRMELPGQYFPNTLYEVIYDDNPRQYTSTGKFYEEEPTEREYEIAYDVWVNGTRTLPEDVVFQTQVMPENGIYYTHTQWHYYCKSIYIS